MKAIYDTFDVIVAVSRCKVLNHGPRTERDS